MEFLDARRLTGPNLLFDEPATVLDAKCQAREAAAMEKAWRANVLRMFAELGWPAPEFASLRLEGGISIGFTAPIDALYAATEINQWAFNAALGNNADDASSDFSAALATIREAYAEECNPRLLELQRAAAARNTSFLWDDDDVSLGMGCHSQTWPVKQVPDPADIEWARFRDIPHALVTGTNGKTTTVRLATRVLREAGLDVGLSSTDWIAVNDRIIDRGDWSGPGGARAVLRDRQANVAILESARGGLLRRGLGVEAADAALITNIDADHLGDFGSRNLDELLEIKWLVSRAVAAHGRLILNADDARLVARARGYSGSLAWFSLAADNATVAAHVAAGGLAWVYANDELVVLRGGQRISICAARDIPITLGGAARHNVANALAAAALCAELGATDEQIAAGLTSMSQTHNPGRGNVCDTGRFRVLVDFAHNPAAMRALFDMAAALPAKRRALCFGQAGDRPDSLIREMVRDAWAIGLQRFYVSELAAYHRGRQHGDVFAVIRDELISLGADPAQIEHHELESESLAAALQWAGEGDLVIMLALGGAAPVEEQLRDFIAQQ